MAITAVFLKTLLKGDKPLNVKNKVSKSTEIVSVCYCCCIIVVARYIKVIRFF